MGSGALLQHSRGLGFWISPVLAKNKQDALSLSLPLPLPLPRPLSLSLSLSLSL
jgi:hypothetical protein